MGAFRIELTGYCYRMLGSPFDAEDADQDTLLRAWRSRASFDHSRSSTRTWLYAVATNRYLDLLKAPRRRRVPERSRSQANRPTSPSGTGSRPCRDVPIAQAFVGPLNDRLLGTFEPNARRHKIEVRHSPTVTGDEPEG